MVQTALQGHGVPLGVAEDAGWMVAFAQSRGEPAVAATIAWCSKPDARSALVTAPSAFDRACAGLTRIDGPDACDGWLAQERALRAARHGLAGLVAWRGGCATAGPGDDGPWFARGTLAEVPPVIARGAGYVVACLRPKHDDDAPFRLSASTRWSAREVREQRDASYRDGIPLTRTEYDALARAGQALLLPHEHEWRVLAEGMDPLKSFWRFRDAGLRRRTTRG
jgi:hypothetical protein